MNILSDLLLLIKHCQTLTHQLMVLRIELVAKDEVKFNLMLDSNKGNNSMD